MSFIPFESFIISTNLSDVEIRQRLNEVVGNAEPYMKRIFKDKKKPFYGLINDNNFKIYIEGTAFPDLVIIGPHEIIGQIDSNQLRIKVKLPDLVIIFFISLFFIFLSIPTLIKPQLKEAVINLLIMVILYSIFTGAVKYFAKITKKYLEKLLQE